MAPFWCAVNLWSVLSNSSSGMNGAVEDHEASAGAWCWFGDALTYANAKMPQALLLAYDVTGTVRFRDIGLASFDFRDLPRWVL